MFYLIAFSTSTIPATDTKSALSLEGKRVLLVGISTNLYPFAPISLAVRKQLP